MVDEFALSRGLVQRIYNDKKEEIENFLHSMNKNIDEGHCRPASNQLWIEIGMINECMTLSSILPMDTKHIRDAEIKQLATEHGRNVVKFNNTCRCACEPVSTLRLKWAIVDYTDKEKIPI